MLIDLPKAAKQKVEEVCLKLTFAGAVSYLIFSSITPKLKENLNFSPQNLHLNYDLLFSGNNSYFSR